MRYNSFFVLGTILIALFVGAASALSSAGDIDKIWILVVFVVLTCVFACGYFSNKEI